MLDSASFFVNRKSVIIKTILRQKHRRDYYMERLVYRAAEERDIQAILDMFAAAIYDMNSNGIPQWDEIYPDREVLEEDIRKKQMTVVLLEDNIAAAYVINTESDVQYMNGKWSRQDATYVVLHRLCVNPRFQHRGIARQVMLHIEEEERQRGLESIRLDAFTKNPFALKLYEALGYAPVGYVDFRKGKFKLMEKLL